MSKLKPSWWDEFLTFAVKGNAMALAVGTIIGGGFGTITKSLTDDIIMPVVNIFLGGADFSDVKIALPRMPWVEPTYETIVSETGAEIVREVQNYLTIGNFLSAVINFAILALVVFLPISVSLLIPRTSQKTTSARMAKLMTAEMKLPMVR